MTRAAIAVKKVTATGLRNKLKTCLREATANRVVLVENRRQASKYLVDKDFLDSLMRERESIFATLEVLADRELTDRLLTLSKTIDRDVAAGRLLTTEDVFGECAKPKTAFAGRVLAKTGAPAICFCTSIYVRRRSGHQSARWQRAEPTPKGLREKTGC